MGIKPSDGYCMPLCLEHHTGSTGVHLLGNVKFLKSYFPELVKPYFEEEAEGTMAEILITNYMEWKNVKLSK